MSRVITHIHYEILTLFFPNRRQKHKVHHIVVSPGGSGKFTGLLSSWDIARECALDAKVIKVVNVAWVTHKR